MADKNTSITVEPGGFTGAAEKEADHSKPAPERLAGPTPEIVEVARMICQMDDPDQVLSILRSFAPARVGH